MYCSQCGAQASGNFCSSCGAPLQGALLQDTDTQAETGDWSSEVRYQELIAVPEIRDLVSNSAAMARKRLSAEEFLALADKIIPLNISLEKLGSALAPVMARLGLETGKQRVEDIPMPPGRVIVAALCSLAREGQTLQQVHQFEDGCLLEAVLPSDMWSWEGRLVASIRRTDAGSRVEAATRIKGQLYDWGKSRRCLDTFMANLKADAV